MTDELLKALGRVQRSQQAELGRAGEDGAEAWRRPLADDEQARLLAAVLGPQSETGVTELGPQAGPGAAEDARVVPLARPRRRWLAGVATLAAAAALLLVLRPGDDEGPALPSYGLVDARGEASARGPEASAGEIVLRPDTAIDWRISPAAAVQGAVDLRIVAEQGAQRRWIDVAAAREVSADGVIRLRGRAGAWPGLPPGAWTLVFVIARPDRLPASLDDFEADVGRPAERGWQLQRVEVRVEG